MEARRAADLADLTSLSALESPVRRRLYEVISAAGRAVGRDEAASCAGVSRSLAAYHLDKLVESGLLEASFQRPGGRGGPGAGRPPKLYRRTARDFVLRAPPRDYQLLGEVLVGAADDDPGGEAREALERAAYRTGCRLGEQARQAGLGHPGGLRDVLWLRGYEPFEDGEGTLRLRNCPFDGLARRNPAVVCGLNLRVLEGLLGAIDAGGARAVLQPSEGHCCVAIEGAATGAP